MNRYAQGWAECRRIANEKIIARAGLNVAIAAILLIGWLTYPN